MKKCTIVKLNDGRVVRRHVDQIRTYWPDSKGHVNIQPREDGQPIEEPLIDWTAPTARVVTKGKSESGEPLALGDSMSSQPEPEVSDN